MRLPFSTGQWKQGSEPYKSSRRKSAKQLHNKSRIKPCPKLKKHNCGIVAMKRGTRLEISPTFANLILCVITLAVVLVQKIAQPNFGSLPSPLTCHTACRSFFFWQAFFTPSGPKVYNQMRLPCKNTTRPAFFFAATFITFMAFKAFMALDLEPRCTGSAMSLSEPDNSSTIARTGIE